MKNHFLEYFKSAVSLRIEGKNLERFLRRLASHKIELLSLKYKGRNQVTIRIYKKDYEKVLELKSVYEMEEVSTHGWIKLKKQLHYHTILLSSFVVGALLLFFLSRVIFQIEIVHTSKEIRSFVTKELDQHGIHKLSMRKSFKELTNIKEDIMKRNKDKIEWLEIERVGTKYVIRLEMRKLPSEEPQYRKQNVIAKKNAVVKKVVAKNGEIIRNTNDYVHEGDVIISGEIKLNEQVKNQVKAEGTVYGEVWYTVDVEYPLLYQETKETGRKRTSYVVKFLNRRLELFQFAPFADRKSEDTILLSHPFLPFSLVKEKQKEVKRIEEINTEEEAINKAIALAKEKMEANLKKEEKILSTKSLKVEVKESKIEVQVFFTVYEDITSYQAIMEEPLESE